MNSPVDKEYLDARLETIMAVFSGEMKEYVSRNETAHGRLEACIDLLREEMHTSIARSENRIIKWVVGAILAQTAVLVSVMSLMFHVAIDRTPAAAPPVVVNIPAPTLH